MTAYLRPTAPIAPDVLLPGDPGAALALAQALLDKPLMANHSHGLWGYSGRTDTGRELTVQSTGIGGPSAALVLAELAAHGARRALALGTCRALEAALEPGQAVIVGRCESADGASRALGATAEPDAELTAALRRCAEPAPAVVAVSLDLPAEVVATTTPASATVADLQAAALLAVAARHGLPIAIAMVVAETAAGERDSEATERGLLSLGAAAAEAFAATAQASATSTLL